MESIVFRKNGKIPIFPTYYFQRRGKINIHTHTDNTSNKRNDQKKGLNSRKWNGIYFPQLLLVSSTNSLGDI